MACNSAPLDILTLLGMGLLAIAFVLLLRSSTPVSCVINTPILETDEGDLTLADTRILQDRYLSTYEIENIQGTINLGPSQGANPVNVVPPILLIG